MKWEMKMVFDYASLLGNCKGRMRHPQLQAVIAALAAKTKGKGDRR